MQQASEAGMPLADSPLSAHQSVESYEGLSNAEAPWVSEANRATKPALASVSHKSQESLQFAMTSSSSACV